MCHFWLKHRTIKVYLAAVRWLYIKEGRENPFQNPLHRLHYVLQGAKREEASRGGSSRVRLPISPSILRQLKSVWEGQGLNPDTTMLWAAACLGFFGFLQLGDMTTPTASHYDSTVHSRSNVAVDNPRKPTVLRVTIK